MNGIVSGIYKEQNDIWGLPQEYKGIKFHPLKIKDIEYIDLFYKIFTHPKNYIPDVTVLKASYLKFLLCIIQPSIDIQNTEFSDGIIKYLRHITGVENVGFEWGYMQGREETFDGIIIRLKIGEVIITEQEFENIREIILEQNGTSIEYVEDYRPDMEENLRLSIGENDITLKDEIFTFCALMCKTIKEIEDYTLYQFKEQMSRMIWMKDFDLFKPLEASGQIKLKHGEIKHYLQHSKKSGRYDSVLISQEEYKSGGGILENVTPG